MQHRGQAALRSFEPNNDDAQSPLPKLELKHPWLRRGAIGLLSAYAGYLGIINVLLSTKTLPGWVNQAQENLDLDYDYAFSLFPGHVSLRNVDLRVQDSAIEFQLTAEHIRTWIHLPSLLQQVFKASDGTVEDGVVRLRTARALPELCAEKAAHVPPILGLARPLALLKDRPACLLQPDTAFLAGPPTPKERLWRVELVEIPAQLKELWIEELRLRGQIEASVSFWLWPSAELRIDPSTVRIRGGLLTSDEVLATDGEVDLEASSEQIDLGDDDLLRFSKVLSTRMDLSAQINSFGLLDTYLSSAGWIRFGRSHGTLKAKVEIERGAVLAGTQVLLNPAVLSMSAYGQRIEGVGTASASVSGLGDQRQARMEVRIPEFKLRRVRAKQAFASGRGLKVVVEGANPGIGSPVPDLDLHLVLGALKLPSFEPFNRYLPPKLGLRLRSGGGQLEAELKVHHGHRLGRGRVHVLSEALKASYADLDLQGIVELTVPIAGADLDTGTFGISDAQLEIRQGQVVGIGSDKAVPWSGELDFKQAKLAISPNEETKDGPRLQANVVTRLADLRPILKVYGAQGRLPSLIRNYSSGEARGTFDLWVSPEWLVLDRLALNAGSLEVQANLYQGSGPVDGGLLVGLQGLRVGLEIDAGSSKLVLLDPTATFQRRANQRRSSWKEKTP